MAVTTSSGNGFALYNGVKLPKLPDYDATAYPYSALWYLDGNLVGFSGEYLVLFAVTDSALKMNGDTFCVDTDYSTFMTINGYFAVGNNIAGAIGIPANEWVIEEASSTEGMSPEGELVWANYDVLNITDNTVYLAATDPIPLDGMTVIEWDGDTTGLPNVNLGATYYRIADYAFATSGFCYARATDDALDDTTGEIFSSEGPIWTIANNESGPLCIAVPEEAKNELGFEQGGIYVFFLPDGAYVSVLAYSADTPSEPTYDRTAFLSGLAMGLCGKGNPTFEGSGKMLYNGVELPNIESVWDKSKYPYACSYTSSSGSWLYLISVPVVYKHGDSYDYVRASSVPYSWQRYTLTNGVFRLEISKENDDYSTLLWGAHWDDLTRHTAWTSHDILLEGEETVFLAATKPVPVEDTFTKGYHVGAELRRKRVIPKAEETATMLYNGVELPNINTVWTDKKTYPYAFIYWDSTQRAAELYLLSSSTYVVDNIDFLGKLLGQNILATEDGTYTRYDCDPDEESQWRFRWNGEKGAGAMVTAVSVSADSMIAWANHNMCYETGELYHAASDPVPVYE